MTSEPCETAVAAGNQAGAAGGSEEQIVALVDLFYKRVHADPLIGPVFADHVGDWDRHMQAMRNFWSTALLGHGTYRGNGFVQHMRLPLEEAHFDRWLQLWQQSAVEALPAALAERAIKRAHHMANSYRVGLLPYRRPDGTLSRTKE